MTLSGEKRIAILQSSYIPWKGYFDLINRVDEFILYDDVQYTKRDWRNRNVIQTPAGLSWLTIPVSVSGRFHQTIQDVEACDCDWRRRHWAALSHNYAKARWFGDYRETFERLYLGSDERRLSRINHAFIVGVCRILGIKTKISWSSDYPATGKKTERLVQICVKADADGYVSGPSGKNYIQPELFRDAGVNLSYVDYDGYPEYPQLSAPFEHHVTILDLIFNVGPQAADYMLSFKGS